MTSFDLRPLLSLFPRRAAGFILLALALLHVAAGQALAADHKLGFNLGTVRNEVSFDPTTGVTWAVQSYTSGYEFLRSDDRGKLWIRRADILLATDDLAITTLNGAIFVGTVASGSQTTAVTQFEGLSGNGVSDVMPALSSGEPIEIAVASNADGQANTVYAAVLTDTGRVGVFSRSPSTRVWTQVGNEMAGAGMNLSLAFNAAQDPTSPHLVVSYLGGDGRVWIRGAPGESGFWTVLDILDESIMPFARTQVVAWRDSIVVAYDALRPAPPGDILDAGARRSIFYAQSDDGGDTWTLAPILVSPSTPESYRQWTVSARGGQGVFLAALQEQAIGDDRIHVLRRGYSTQPLGWTELGDINQHAPDHFRSLAMEWTGDGMGIAYVDDTSQSYLHKLDLGLFVDRFESGDLSAWSGFVQTP